MFTAKLPTAADTRRSALRDRLTDIAEATIAIRGLSALRARDLAVEAGCALGAIYTVFPALDDLVLLVNARTFARMGAAIGQALADTQPAPRAQMTAMALAYAAFARDNRPAWSALFTIDRPAGTSPPDWYKADMDQLLALIEAPLQALMPDLTAPDRVLMARALFSAIHGIVSLGLDDATSGVPQAQIDRMITLVLARMT